MDCEGLRLPHCHIPHTPFGSLTAPGTDSRARPLHDRFRWFCHRHWPVCDGVLPGSPAFWPYWSHREQSQQGVTRGGGDREHRHPRTDELHLVRAIQRRPRVGAVIPWLPPVAFSPFPLLAGLCSPDYARFVESHWETKPARDSF